MFAAVAGRNHGGGNCHWGNTLCDQEYSIDRCARSEVESEDDFKWASVVMVLNGGGPEAGGDGALDRGQEEGPVRTRARGGARVSGLRMNGMEAIGNR